MKLGEKIKNFRLGSGLTQEQLAQLLCVSRQAISNWETCRTEPDLDMLSRISATLHHNLECFFNSDTGSDDALRCSCMQMIDGMLSKPAFEQQPDFPGTEYEGGLLYNGKSIRLKPGRNESGRYAVLTDDGLCISLEISHEHDAVYILPRIKNNGSSDSGQISLLRSLDMLLPETDVVFSTLNGDNSDQSSFFPVEKPLKIGDTIKISPNGGRSSDGSGFPFFTVGFGSEALLIALGWSGQWSFEVSVDQRGTRLTAGLPNADFFLHPGEEIRLPSVLLIRGVNDDSIYRTLKNYFRAKLSEFYPENLSLPISCAPFDRYFWNNRKHPCFSQDGQKRVVDLMNGCKGFEVLWLDAAWFVNVENFPAGVGNYTCNDSFPDGLTPVADYAHKSGYSFIVWFEPERVCGDTDINRAHPEYMLKLNDDYNLMYNLGNPQAVEYLKNLLVDFIRKNHIDIYRQDFNMWPLEYWRKNDQPGRSGLTEIHYIDGLYRLWDGIHAEIPGILIDNCASGGRRLDLETCMRSVPLWRSDMGCNQESPTHRATVWKQNCTVTLSRYLPYHCSGSWNPSGYEFRSGCTSGAVCGFNILDDDFDFQAASEALTELHRLRGYWQGEFFQVTKPTLNETGWMIYRLEKEGSGVIYCFRREQSRNPEMLVSVPDAAAESYRLVLSDEQYQTTLLTVTGSELRRGIPVRISQPRASLTVEFKPVKK